MCEWLFYLKIYLSLLENEGELTCNLTESQWHNFTIAQRLLEGDVYKIRKGLQQAIESPTSTA